MATQLSSLHSLSCCRLVRPCQRPASYGSIRPCRQQALTRAQDSAPEAKPPKGVTQPPSKPATPPAWFGFVDNAERQNSRAAMIGFFSLLILEFVTKKGILELLGLKTGGGLGFEF
ncbi:hypothetical protein WJX74_009130 [Apatococcus lobatus]|uniref:Uncharacterized protein n=1 Tax=Apatococcus lobatus TaxID=904363 RepID=A0AAW1Q218_9CHLO